jgi:quinol monooxygenase YgiN
MSQIVLIAKITTQPGKRPEAVAAFQPLLDHAETEPGTLTYRLHEDANDADALWMYEVYADQAGLDAHRASDTMKTAGRALGQLLAGAPQLTYLSAVGGTPL